MPNLDDFIAAYHDGDNTALLILADWLEERGDMRATVLRVLHNIPGGYGLHRCLGLFPERMIGWNRTFHLPCEHLDPGYCITVRTGPMRLVLPPDMRPGDGYTIHNASDDYVTVVGANHAFVIPHHHASFVGVTREYEVVQTTPYDVGVLANGDN